MSTEIVGRLNFKGDIRGVEPHRVATIKYGLVEPALVAYDEGEDRTTIEYAEVEL